jgi:hypothetical protein
MSVHLFALEHRYYGKSYPGKHNAQSLAQYTFSKHCTSQQRIVFVQPFFMMQYHFFTLEW